MLIYWITAESERKFDKDHSSLGLKFDFIPIQLNFILNSSSIYILNLLYHSGNSLHHQLHKYGPSEIYQVHSMLDTKIPDQTLTSWFVSPIFSALTLSCFKTIITLLFS